MNECIILAGGFGTRLKSVVKDVPKCMAQVSGKPFLFYLFDYLNKQGIEHVVLALGYKHEYILDWLKANKFSFKVSYIIEQEPLGTGGAIQYACQKINTDYAFIVNGDTFFQVDLFKFLDFHKSVNADISIVLKPMLDFDRYGSVDIDETNRIVAFKEKQFCHEGLINGGIYLIQKEIFSILNLPEKYSFEKDILEAKLNTLQIFGFEQDTYFIDIGIPADFQRANQDFTNIVVK